MSESMSYGNASQTSSTTGGDAYDQAAWDAYNNYYRYQSTYGSAVSSQYGQSYGQNAVASGVDPNVTTGTAATHDNFAPSTSSLYVSYGDAPASNTTSTTTYDGLSMMAAAYANSKKAAQSTTYDASAYASYATQATPTAYSQSPVSYSMPPTIYSQSDSTSGTNASSSSGPYQHTYSQGPVTYPRPSEGSTSIASSRLGYAQESQSSAAPVNKFLALGDYYFENPYLCDSEDDESGDWWGSRGQYDYQQNYRRPTFHGRQRFYQDVDPTVVMERRTHQLLNQRYNDELTNEETRIIIQQLKETTGFTSSEYNDLGVELRAAFREYTRYNRRSPSSENEWWHVTRHLELTCEYISYKIQQQRYEDSWSHNYGYSDSWDSRGPMRRGGVMLGSGAFQDYSQDFSRRPGNMQTDKVRPLLESFPTPDDDQDGSKKRFPKKQRKCMQDLKRLLPRLQDPEEAKQVRVGLLVGLLYTFRGKFPLHPEERLMISRGIEEAKLLHEESRPADMQLIVRVVQNVCDIIDARFTLDEPPAKTTPLFSRGIADSMTATLKVMMEAFERRAPEEAVQFEDDDEETENTTDDEDDKQATFDDSDLDENDTAQDVLAQDLYDREDDILVPQTDNPLKDFPELSDEIGSKEPDLSLVDTSRGEDVAKNSDPLLPSINTYSLGIACVSPSKSEVFISTAGSSTTVTKDGEIEPDSTSVEKDSVHLKENGEDDQPNKTEDKPEQVSEENAPDCGVDERDGNDTKLPVETRAAGNVNGHRADGETAEIVSNEEKGNGQCDDPSAATKTATEISFDNGGSFLDKQQAEEGAESANQSTEVTHEDDASGNLKSDENKK